MSHEQKQALKEEAKATISKVGWWVLWSQRIFVAVMVSVIAKAVLFGGAEGIKAGVSVVTTFRQLQTDRDSCKQFRMAQLLVNANQAKINEQNADSLRNMEATVTTHGKTIVELWAKQITLK